MKKTKEFKGTPGPWEFDGVNPKSNGWVNVTTKDGSITIYTGYVRDAKDRGNPALLEKSIANAKAVSAVPELLKVAQMVDAKYSQEKMDKKAKGYDLFLSVGESEIWTAAKEALKKAAL